MGDFGGSVFVYVIVECLVLNVLYPLFPHPCDGKKDQCEGKKAMCNA